MHRINSSGGRAVEVASAGSQSLFNIYYLGQTSVDRRCTSSIMPWIIEELKLNVDEWRFIWLSPGPDKMSFVADNGQEILSHSYGSIIQCCLALDGISFAYIAHQDKDKYVCHVFQAFTYEEATKIMAQFKQHAKEEVAIPATNTRSIHSLPPSSSASPCIRPDSAAESGTSSSSYVMSLQHQSSNGGGRRASGLQGDGYRLVYLGSYKIPPPAATGDGQVQIIDSLVGRVRESMATQTSRMGLFHSKKKRSIGALRKRKSGNRSLDSESTLSKSSPPLIRSSTCDDSHCSREEQLSPQLKQGHSTPDISVHSPTSPTYGLSDGAAASGDFFHDQEEGPEKEWPSRTSSHKSTLLQTHTVSENAGFDTIPELVNLQNSSEFQALSSNQKLQKEGSHTKPSSIKVQLVFSGVHMVVIAEDSSQVLFKKSIKTIGCCAQGKRDSEYLAFTSRNAEHKHICYLFLARSSRQAIQVLDSFKASFVHSLSLSMPPASCESCPMQKIQQLCISLEGVSTQVAQSKLQDCLSYLNEADYSMIMQLYKASEHADHEYTQIIVLVALLRQHFQRQQDKHTHRGLVTSKVDLGLCGLHVEEDKGGPGVEEISPRLRLSTLTRAKNVIANSFENLRSRPPLPLDKKTRKSALYVTSEQRPYDLLFAHKSNINTLMSPVHANPSNKNMAEEKVVCQSEKDDVRWNRAWTAGVSPPNIRGKNVSSENERVSESAPLRRRKDEAEQSAVLHSLPAQTSQETSQAEEQYLLRKTTQHLSFPRTRGLREFQQRNRQRHLSLTPPSSSASLSSKEKFHREHRRAASHGISSSWRQELFESVATPSKMDRKCRRTPTSSDILDEFEIIELSSPGKGGGKSWGGGGMGGERTCEPSVARRRWQDAIHQQLLLIRMDKENQLLKNIWTAAGKKKLKLYYKNAVSDSGLAMAVWKQLLMKEEGARSNHDVAVPAALLMGVPASAREEVWQWLSRQYQVAHLPQWSFPEELIGEKAFTELRQQTTEYDHNIAVDIGRTFPSHPYFSSSLQEGGQAELYHILHAYAVADSETGYCQGLSFVTGIILMHTKDESSAFALLYKLMNLHAYKDIYNGSLAHLQVRLYQLSRLIHDFIPPLHHLLLANEVTPFFYAAPWFLTIFASQYPISFVARVFDLIFYEGTDVLFKVALSLLKLHLSELLKCQSMEAICHYLKTRLPDDMEKVTGQETAILEEAMAMDFEGRLKIFETEYEVMDELIARFRLEEMSLGALDDVSVLVRKNNLVMVEQLAICHGSISTLQQEQISLRQQLQDQQKTIARLEAQLQNSS